MKKLVIILMLSLGLTVYSNSSDGEIEVSVKAQLVKLLKASVNGEFYSQVHEDELDNTPITTVTLSISGMPNEEVRVKMPKREALSNSLDSDISFDFSLPSATPIGENIVAEYTLDTEGELEIAIEGKLADGQAPNVGEYYRGEVKIEIQYV